MIALVKGREVDLHSYYPCCETEEPSCSWIWNPSMLVGPESAEPPYPLWRRASFDIPAGVELILKIGETPCTRLPEEPHEWWYWRWVGQPEVLFIP